MVIRVATNEELEKLKEVEMGIASIISKPSSPEREVYDLLEGSLDHSDVFDSEQEYTDIVIEDE